MTAPPKAADRAPPAFAPYIVATPAGAAIERLPCAECGEPGPHAEHLHHLTALPELGSLLASFLPLCPACAGAARASSWAALPRAWRKLAAAPEEIVGLVTAEPRGGVQ